VKGLGRRLAAALNFLAAGPHDAVFESTTMPCRLDDAMHADACPGEHPALRCTRCGLTRDTVTGRMAVTS
jgi:hypothetical protein